MSVRGMDSVSLTVPLGPGPWVGSQISVIAGRPLTLSGEQAGHESPNSTLEPLWEEGKPRQRSISTGSAGPGVSCLELHWGIWEDAEVGGVVGRGPQAWLRQAANSDVSPAPAPQINKGS